MFLGHQKNISLKQFQSAKKSPLANTEAEVKRDYFRKNGYEKFQSAKKSPLANTEAAAMSISEYTLSFNRLKNRL